MAYIKIVVLGLSALSLAFLIYLAAQKDNLTIAGILSLSFFIVSYLGLNMVIKHFKVDVDEKSLEVSSEDAK